MKFNQLLTLGFAFLAGSSVAFAQTTEEPKSITCCLNLIIVTKALERVADRAANIAEDVFYLYRGRDIRHSSTTRAA
jgi:phosphate uptake regulator